MFRKKAALILFILAIAAGLAGCKDTIIYGEITHISSTEITVKTGSYQESSLPEGDSASEKTDSANQSDAAGNNASDPGAEGESDKRSDRAEAAGDAPLQRAGGFTPDGESATYPLSEEVDADDLLNGDLIKLTLTEDVVSSIELMQSETTAASRPETKAAEISAAYIVDHREKTSVHESFDSSEPDVSAVLVKNKGSLELREGGLTKSGNTSNQEESNFYGLNAVLLASGGSTASIRSTTFHSGASGANAVFATGKNTKIQLSQFKIYTTEDSSHGLDATHGGTIIASGGKISTKGAYCAPIAANRSNGTVKVRNSTLKSAGTDSPCIYSTGSVTCTDVSGNASGSQIAVIEGKNRITLKDCFLQGAGENGIMLYQGTSHNTAEGNAFLKAAGSKLTTTSKGPMFYVTNTKASAVLKNTTLYFSSGILAKVAGNNTKNWGVPGKNGGTFTLKGVNQTFKGDIVCDTISTVSLALTKKSVLNGAVNHSGEAKAASVSLDKTSLWNVSSDSYVTELINKETSCRNILSGGHTVYYDADQAANKWLGGKTVSLPGGGKLTPSESSGSKETIKSSGSSKENTESVIRSDLSTKESSSCKHSGSDPSSPETESTSYPEQLPDITTRNGRHLTLQGTGQTLTGDITCTSGNSISLSLTQNTSLTGAVNPDRQAKSVSVFLDQSSTWNVTADSYITEFSNEDTSCRNLLSGGHTIYYDADQAANKWLGGKTVSLPGGGKLAPSK